MSRHYFGVLFVQEISLPGGKHDDLKLGACAPLRESFWHFLQFSSRVSG
jgi:hypothetical protein